MRYCRGIVCREREWQGNVLSFKLISNNNVHFLSFYSTYPGKIFQMKRHLKTKFAKTNKMIMIRDRRQIKIITFYVVEFNWRIQQSCPRHFFKQNDSSAKKYEKSNFAKNIAFGKVTLLHPLDLVGVLDNLVDLALELALLLQLLVLLDPFYNFLEYKYLGTLFFILFE